jgi:hypothetical protein
MSQVDWVGRAPVTSEAVTPARLAWKPRARPGRAPEPPVPIDTSTLPPQQRLVLEVLAKWPGSTACELAKVIAGQNWLSIRHMVSRRLPELASETERRKGQRVLREYVYVKRGRPRLCQVAGTTQTTGYAEPRRVAKIRSA